MNPCKHVATGILMLIATSGYSSEIPLLSKTFQPSHWLPLHPYSKCEIYADKIVIHRAIGINLRLETLEERHLSFSENSLNKLEEAIELANQGELKPGEVTSADTELLSYETPRKLVLRKANIGQWKSETVNTSAVSGLLVGFLDIHCPDTY